MLRVGTVDFDTAGTDAPDSRSFAFRGVERARAGWLAWSTRRSGSRSRRRQLEPGGVAQRGGLVGALPREVVVVAAEVAVGGGLLVDRPVQLELLAERARAQVEVLVDELRRSCSRPIFSVPNVSTITETGCATPIA